MIYPVLYLKFSFLFFLMTRLKRETWNEHKNTKTITTIQQAGKEEKKDKRYSHSSLEITGKRDPKKKKKKKEKRGAKDVCRCP